MNSLIDRQAAIEIIQNMYPGMPRVPWLRKDWQERYDPYIRVEKAIRELPSAQPEQLCVANVTLTDEQVREALEKAKNSVLTVIESERKKGKWGFDKGKLVCSVCGARFDHNISDYCNMDNPKHCPDCGARMEGEEE